jgi:hypothetical protein
MGVGSAVSSTGGVNVDVLNGSATSLRGRWLAHAISAPTEVDAAGGTLSRAEEGAAAACVPLPPPPHAETPSPASAATNVLRRICRVDFMFRSFAISGYIEPGNGDLR